MIKQSGRPAFIKRHPQNSIRSVFRSCGNALHIVRICIQRKIDGIILYANLIRHAVDDSLRIADASSGNPNFFLLCRRRRLNFCNFLIRLLSYGAFAASQICSGICFAFRKLHIHDNPIQIRFRTNIQYAEFVKIYGVKIPPVIWLPQKGNRAVLHLRQTGIDISCRSSRNGKLAKQRHRIVLFHQKRKKLSFCTGSASRTSDKDCLLAVNLL